MHISRTRNEKDKIIIDNSEIHRIIRNYFEKCYSNKLKNLGEIANFLDKFDLKTN